MEKLDIFLLKLALVFILYKNITKQDKYNSERKLMHMYVIF
jgi:hypothetical protein